MKEVYLRQRICSKAHCDAQCFNKTLLTKANSIRIQLDLVSKFCQNIAVCVPVRRHVLMKDIIPILPLWT